MGFLRPLSRGAIAAVTGIAVLGVGGVVVGATRLASSGGDDGSAGPGAASRGAPAVKVVGLHHGHVSWQHPLKLRSIAGSLESVVVLSRAGVPVEGSMSEDGTRWVSSHRLIPLTHYRARVVLAGDDGAVTKTVRVRSTDTK